MCGIELMFYSECFGSRGPRGLAGGKKTCSPERLPSPHSLFLPPCQESQSLFLRAAGVYQ